MNAYYEDDRATIYHGDCIEVMRSLPENSVDSIVTDPPYGLEFMGKEWDSPWKDHRSKIGKGGDYPNGGKAPTLPQAYIAGAGFQLWFTEVATEALRVLKPGGHLLAFGGTRTWHRLAVAIEDAGFEVRDSIAWMYGSGFPKSLDVSKAIDKNNGEVGRLWKFTAYMRTTGLTAKQLNEATGTFMGSHYLTDKSQPSIPTPELWQVVRPLCADVPAWVDDLVARIAAEREVTGQYETAAAAQQWMNNYGLPADLTAKERKDKPATPAAQQWQGFGTALKPAFEPIVVARKPLIGTVADNVLKHGTGAMNIDGCRIAATADDFAKLSAGVEAIRKRGGTMDNSWKNSSDLSGASPANPAGRWPANVILDESQAAELDRQSGDVKGQVGMTKTKGGHRFIVGDTETVQQFDHGTTDFGGASRFFYCAKANKKERPNVDGVAHPTVKPLKLMEYLCRLVTPPGGTILEPFAGSGTTIEAALNEGFNVIGIEMTDEYLPLIMARIERHGEKLC